jgi:hypothetical protein
VNLAGAGRRLSHDLTWRGLDGGLHRDLGESLLAIVTVASTGGRRHCWQGALDLTERGQRGVGLERSHWIGHGSVQDRPSFSIRHTPGADRKLPLPDSFVILVAVPLYSPVDGSLQGHEVSTESGSGGGIDPRHIITAQKL